MEINNELTLASTLNGSVKATDFASNSIKEGFSRADWNRIEKRLNAFEKGVLDSLDTLANNIVRGNRNDESQINNMTKKALGDIHYLTIRPEFVKAKILPDRIPKIELPNGTINVSNDTNADNKNNKTNNKNNKTNNKKKKRKSSSNKEKRQI